MIGEVMRIAAKFKIGTDNHHNFVSIWGKTKYACDNQPAKVLFLIRVVALSYLLGHRIPRRNIK